jgi:hypothetical protein
MVRLTTLLAVVIAMPPITKASIIPIFTSGPTASGSGGYNYDYTADLQQEGRLDPAATNGVTCLSMSVLVPCNPSGTFFTIYDFAGYTSSSASAAGWGISTQSVGLTPSTLLPPDDGTLTNITFFYTGDVVHADGDVVPFPGFEIVSSLNRIDEGWYSSQDTNDAGLDAGTTNQTVGRVIVPVGGQGTGPLGGPVPEPGTACMLLLGCAAVIASLRRKRN